ncbi:MAG: hypothetical protein QXJ69_07200 [Desulfurococcaceae archaeon]
MNRENNRVLIITNNGLVINFEESNTLEYSKPCLKCIFRKICRRF